MLLLKFHKYLRAVASLMNSLSVLAHAFTFAFFKEYLLQLFTLKILETIFIKEKKKIIFHPSPNILHVEICLLVHNALSFWLLKDELRRICLSFLKAQTLCIPPTPCIKLDLYKHLYCSHKFYVSFSY